MGKNDDKLNTDTKKYFIRGTFNHEKKTAIRNLTQKHYDSLHSRIGKYSRDGNTIISIHEIIEKKERVNSWY